MSDSALHPKPVVDRWRLLLAALGVVFGDIGTSPLYALKESLSPSHGVILNTPSILGVLSLIFWALIGVVTLKYVLLVMRAHNHGEGGIFALAALSLRGFGPNSTPAKWVFILGVVGACLFYGDAVITPAISVLSAVEGLNIIHPDLQRVVLPMAVVILVLLFALQSRGTEKLGRWFGPIVLLWFISIAVLGIRAIQHQPSVLLALNPVYAVQFIHQNGAVGYLVLGSVFLAVTGAEALYADMGHFGAGPIRWTWNALVLPALVLSYFGQGALLLEHPEALANPFYRLAPNWALWPLLILATLATVIASQAVISGAFSLTSQAIQLGYLPRMRVLHTSRRVIGQIYLPLVNWLLLAATLAVVLGFQASARLGAAYGIAVTTTMVITSALVIVVMVHRWHWPRWAAYTIGGAFLILDTAFFGANLLKFAHGGWLPLLIAGSLLFIILTWVQGRRLLRARTAGRSITLDAFLTHLQQQPVARTPGTAVYLTADSSNQPRMPSTLLRNLRHHQVLHQQVILLAFVTEDRPYINAKDRLQVEHWPGNVATVRAFYGFKQTPDVVKLLPALVAQHQLDLDLAQTSFFIARDTISPSEIPGLALWRERFFAWLYRNAARAPDFFKLPAERVVELGGKIEI